MSDIFISYSSKDREHAEQLTELLASSGISVWIDKSGIDVATSWSGEIVDAIDECKAFVVLLSPSSIASLNVIKEVSLAAEQKKKILPLDLEPVELPRELKYHLAGIQRAPMTNTEGIIRALNKLGIVSVETPHRGVSGEDTNSEMGRRRAGGASLQPDDRKSLMILPFEDLSPTADNQWFADGIVSEMISALSNVKAIRIADNQATKEFRNYHGQLTTYAHTMNIRYFVQGDVRKFGDQIKISSRLLDIETGDHLWQDSMKGTMNDIFEIQESVALSVVEGLKIHLASDEKKKLAERGTENAEAYELFLKANEYFARQTKEGFQLAAQLHSEAINLDPGYANAYTNKVNALSALYRNYKPGYANAYTNKVNALSALYRNYKPGYANAYTNKVNALSALYRNYKHDPALIDEGIVLITKVLRLKPDQWSAYGALSSILRMQGKFEEAERTANKYVQNVPDDYHSHFMLAFFYINIGQHAKAIPPLEQALKFKPENLQILFNLTVSCNGAEEVKKQKEYAESAIPKYEKHLKLFPDDENNRVNHAVLLHFAGCDDEARAAARKLDDLQDGKTLYNTACLQCSLKDYSAGLLTFCKAIQAGLRNMRSIKSFLDEEDEGIGTLKSTPEWEAVRELVEKIEAEQTSA